MNAFTHGMISGFIAWCSFRATLYITESSFISVLIAATVFTFCAAHFAHQLEKGNIK